MSDSIEVMGNRAKSDEPGQLAEAIVAHINRADQVTGTAVALPRSADVLVYCRRTDETLDAAAEYASARQIPLLYLSSGLDTDRFDTVDFPFIDVSNSALDVISFMTDVEEAAKGTYANWNMTIEEHHQSSKKDTSGTAKKLADMVGMDYGNIISHRGFELAHELFGIPEGFANGYAVHRVTFTNPKTNEISKPYDVVMYGRDHYAKGVLDVYRAVKENPEEMLKPGRRDIVDLVKQRIVTIK